MDSGPRPGAFLSVAFASTTVNTYTVKYSARLLSRQPQSPLPFASLSHQAYGRIVDSDESKGLGTRPLHPPGPVEIGVDSLVMADSTLRDILRPPGR